MASWSRNLSLFVCAPTAEGVGQKDGEQSFNSDDSSCFLARKPSECGVAAQDISSKIAEVELRFKQAVADIDIKIEESQAALESVISEKLANAKDRAMCVQMDSCRSEFEFLDEKMSVVENKLLDLEGTMIKIEESQNHGKAEDEFRSELRHLQSNLDIKLGKELNDRILGTLQAAITPMAELLSRKMMECEHKLNERLDSIGTTATPEEVT